MNSPNYGEAYNSASTTKDTCNNLKKMETILTKGKTNLFQHHSLHTAENAADFPVYTNMQRREGAIFFYQIV